MCIQDVSPGLQGEAVTFMTLGHNLITLQTIHNTLNNILKVRKEKID